VCGNCTKIFGYSYCSYSRREIADALHKDIHAFLRACRVYLDIRSMCVEYNSTDIFRSEKYLVLKLWEQVKYFMSSVLFQQVIRCSRKLQQNDLYNISPHNSETVAIVFVKPHIPGACTRSEETRSVILCVHFLTCSSYLFSLSLSFILYIPYIISDTKN
jgi:hypothetical protein